MTSKIKVDTIEEKTSGNGVAIDNVTLKDGGITATASSTITVADNSDTLSLISTDADANAAPILRLFRNSASPADDDVAGSIVFSGGDDNGNETDYASIKVITEDVTNGTEDGRLSFNIIDGGSAREVMSIFDNFVGIGTTAPEQLLHIHGGDSGSSYSADGADKVIIEHNDSLRIDMRTGATNSAGIMFSDGTRNRGEVSYSHNSDGMSLSTVGSTRMIITSTGIVLIGTTSATNGQIEVKSSTTNSIKGYFANSTGNFQNMRLFSDVGGTETETFRVENDGDVKNTNSSYGSISDERIKQDITDASSQWEDIKAVKVKNFKRIDQVNAGLDNKMIGVIAQDLEEAGMSGLVKESIPSTGEIRANEIFGTIEERQIYYDQDDPEVQNGEKTINDVKDTVLEEKPSGETVKSVKYSVLYMKAIKALQEAIQRIETLEAEVSALKGE